MNELKYKTIDLASKNDLDKFEVIKENSKYRPKFHITPPHGLLNDPNGFCYFNNEYHLFYQWYPFDTFHGMKHWMHLTSSDLFHWQEHGAKITPTEKYESHGAYSGAAIVEGEQAYLFYTGNIKLESGRDANQCLALLSADNRVVKYSGNPVIQSVPNGYTGHVRDPKVLKRGEHYFMLLGAQREKDLQGCIIVYQSNDMLHWDFKGELSINVEGKFLDAYMFECPDLLTVDGHDVLIFSPQGVEPCSFRFHNKFNVIYCLGHIDFDTLTFDVTHWDELDRGFDFYAPQSLANTPDKQTIIAWAGTDEVLPSMEHGWIHCLTLPRSLSVKSNRLCQFPEQLLKTANNHQQLEFLIKQHESIELNNLSFYLDVHTNNNNDDFSISLQNSNGKEITLSIQGKNILLSRKGYEHHDSDWNFGSERQLETDYDINNIKIISDESILEIYINDGMDVFTCLFFPDESNHQVNISSGKNQPLDVEFKYLTI
ncbi:glycoside hydrolase family 32 protein [Vibrio japonicus]|uniref:Sucrose-6-phosphate hydrolase n=1 Tax=Vibrio japonicus TaxID=1824638 RepID=A0ABY5LG03_9VIBR|nr:glycoside hydrolase family 32 protein [Vibrio japonicus]UUM30055.1 glycoside hydrolase family 32 protein [Vibrio japonicus]